MNINTINTINTGYNYCLNINRYIKIREITNMYNSSYKKERLSTILEPLQAMVQLALLSFAPIGSKVSIYENLLSIQLSKWSQAILRNYYNDKKDDLYYLFSVINRFNKFYVNKQTTETQEKLFSLLNDMAYTGLYNLVQTYSSNINITNTLNMYKSMIKNPALCEAYEREKHDLTNQNNQPNQPTNITNIENTSTKKDKKKKNTNTTSDEIDTNCENEINDKDNTIDSLSSYRNRVNSNGSNCSNTTNQIDDLFINIKSIYRDYHYELLYNFLLMVQNDDLQYQSYIDGINTIFTPLNAEIKNWINNNLSC